MDQKPVSQCIAQAKRPLLSYEFFPPKDEAGMQVLQLVADSLRSTAPDFVTVTYGAGGTTRSRTLQVCQLLMETGFAPVVHHLTCAGATRTELEQSIAGIYEHGLRNIMALRGDPPRGETQFRRPPDGLAHAVELIRLIKRQYPDMCCGVAGYPEVHPEALSPESDVLYLKDKLDAGGAFVTTQLFYDNTVYFRFERQCRDWGIRAPIIPGLLPASSLSQLRRMAGLCRATLPDALVCAMEQCGNDAECAEQIGLDWTMRQIEELLAHGVPGVHLYILNRAKFALAPALQACFNRLPAHWNPDQG